MSTPFQPLGTPLVLILRYSETIRARPMANIALNTRGNLSNLANSNVCQCRMLWLVLCFTVACGRTSWKVLWLYTGPS